MRTNKQTNKQTNQDTVSQDAASIRPAPITIESLCYSDTAIARGIDNSPPSSLLPNLRRLASGLDSIQIALGSAIDISSGYRCPELNRIVGGTPGSQHQLGQAADFVCTAFGEPIQVATAIVNSRIDYDQIILEFGRWVHVSFSASPRRRALTIYASADGYLDGIVTSEGHRLA
ncbi:MAG: D-Ala-D-Ala carboxypeptidase family metallohydrolase [Burkholderiales bacterium]